MTSRCKVFCNMPQMNGYSGDPVDHFNVHVEFIMHNIDDENVVTMSGDACDIDVPLDTNMHSVVSQVFDYIVAHCAANGHMEPSKVDVFGYFPVSFAELLPDAPTFS